MYYIRDEGEPRAAPSDRYLKYIILISHQASRLDTMLLGIQWISLEKVSQELCFLFYSIIFWQESMIMESK